MVPPNDIQQETDHFQITTMTLTRSLNWKGGDVVG